MNGTEVAGVASLGNAAQADGARCNAPAVGGRRLALTGARLRRQLHRRVQTQRHAAGHGAIVTFRAYVLQSTASDVRSSIDGVIAAGGTTAALASSFNDICALLTSYIIAPAASANVSVVLTLSATDAATDAGIDGGSDLTVNLVGMIVGGVVGGACLVSCLVGACVLMLRGRHTTPKHLDRNAVIVSDQSAADEMPVGGSTYANPLRVMIRRENKSRFNEADVVRPTDNPSNPRFLSLLATTVVKPRHVVPPHLNDGHGSRHQQRQGERASHSRSHNSSHSGARDQARARSVTAAMPLTPIAPPTRHPISQSRRTVARATEQAPLRTLHTPRLISVPANRATPPSPVLQLERPVTASPTSPARRGRTAGTVPSPQASRSASPVARSLSAFLHNADAASTSPAGMHLFDSPSPGADPVSNFARSSRTGGIPTPRLATRY